MIPILHYATALHVPSGLVEQEPSVSLSAYIEEEARGPFSLFVIEHVALLKELVATAYEAEDVLHSMRRWKTHGMDGGWHVRFDENMKEPGVRYSVLMVTETPDVMQRVEVRALHRLLCIGPGPRVYTEDPQ